MVTVAAVAMIADPAVDADAIERRLVALNRIILTAS